MLPVKVIIKFKQDENKKKIAGNRKKMNEKYNSWLTNAELSVAFISNEDKSIEMF